MPKPEQTVRLKHTLTGPNFNEWFRALKLVVRTEKIQDVFETALPPRPVGVGDAPVDPQALAEWTVKYDRHNKVAYLMLGMYNELYQMYGKPPGVELQELIHLFHTCKQGDGTSVSDHFLLMKSYLDQLASLNYTFDDKIAIGFILKSLTSDFHGFVQNYNMQSMGKTLSEVHQMLIEYEKGIKKNNQQTFGASSSTPQVMAIQDQEASTTKERASGKRRTVSPLQGGRTLEAELSDISSRVAKRRRVDKWLPLHLQGFRGARKLKHGSLYLYVDNGMRAEVEAIGSFDLHLPNGLIIVLDNCHYAPTITRGDFHGFVQNYNMQSMGKTLSKVHQMLIAYEKCIKKNKQQTVGAFSSTPQVMGFGGARKLKRGSLYLYVGNGMRAKVEAIGSFDLHLHNGLIIVLDNCHYAPTITRGVVSVSGLVNKGFSHCFTDYGLSVSMNNIIYYNAITVNDVYEIDMRDSTLPIVNSMYSISKNKANLVWILFIFGIVMTKKPFSHKTEKVNDVLGLIHTDVCGPLRHVSKKGASYFITFSDDYSRYGYIYLLKHKHEVFETFKVFKNEVENQLGKTIKALRFDDGCEYISQEFKDNLKACGIFQQLTPPYMPQHNGVSERRNQTRIPNMVSTKKVDKKVVKSKWIYKKKTDMDGVDPLCMLLDAQDLMWRSHKTSQANFSRVLLYGRAPSKVHTYDNLADPFTKALAGPKLTRHARSMGLRPASSF
nr:hypothetical protein [Tanacetum cinerariifolium]